MASATTAVAALLAVASIASAWTTGRSGRGIDFYQVWVVGQVVGRQDVVDIYEESERAAVGAEFYERARASGIPRLQRAASRRGHIAATATPFLFTIFHLALTGEYERDFHQYLVLSLAAGTSAIIYFCWALGYSMTGALVAVAVFNGLFFPAWSDLHVANVNRLQLGGLALFVGLTRQRLVLGGEILGGAVLGLALLFKPNIAPAVGLLSVWRLAGGRWKELARLWAGICGGAVAALVASSIAFGSPACWLRWFDHVSWALCDPPSVDLGNLALAALARRPSDLWMLRALLGGVARAAATSGARRRRAAADPGRAAPLDVLMIGLGGAVGLLTATLAWVHYFVLLAPCAIYALRPGARRNIESRHVLAGSALCALLGAPPSFVSNLEWALLYSLAALVLLGVGVADLMGAQAGTPREEAGRG